MDTLITPGKNDPVFIGICTQLGSDWCSWSQTPATNTEKWVNLKISQRESQATNKWIYEVQVDDKLVYSIPNSNPQKWSNVNVVMGNTYSNNLYESAQGEYRSFKLSSCKL